MSDYSSSVVSAAINLVTLSVLGKLFSRRQLESVFIFIFKKTGIRRFMLIFSIGDNLHEMSNPVFRGKSEYIINLSSAEIIQRVIKVK